jgi:GT2 family glycosyltransferase
MSAFEPLAHPLVFEQPRRLTDVDSWHEHIPFAFFAVAALRPRVVVELGTWKGDSYCALCQAVQSLALPARCYAVDTWAGDEHTGAYGPETLEELRAHHDRLYGGFSTLLQQTFDEASPSFADGSVDLLHIDGAHSYEAVSHDVETWLPKLGDRGVLMLHDTNVHQEGFGVWRLWDELSPRYPGFAFAQGHGLGVLAIGPDVDGEFVQFLRDAERDYHAAAFFSALGARIAAPAREQRLRAAVGLEAARRLAEVEDARAREATAARYEAAQARAEADAIRSESERLHGESDRLRGEIDVLRVERDRATIHLRAREKDIAEVIRSPSWRVTAPLRTTKHNLMRAREARHKLDRLRRSRFPRSTDFSTPPPETRPSTELDYRPLVSVVTPVFDIDPRWLSRAVESVRAQTYPAWQLCLADDGSTNAAIVEYLKVLAGDPAITVTFGEGGGIAAATNRGIASAEGEFVAFLDHDDELEPDALLECVRRLNERPGTDIVYTDEDKLDHRGRPTEPFFKPDWSPEYFRGVMYVGHLLLVRHSLLERVGGADSEFDRVQDFELMLRLSEQTDRIEHVPRILYHWRKLPGSIAESTDAKDGISELQAAAVNAHLERCGIAAFARPNPAFPHRAIVHPKPRARWPRVSVIVPTKDAPEQLERCLRSLYSRSTYPSFEVLLVDNGTTAPAAKRLFETYPVQVLPFAESFNFSRVNNLGVAHATGELVVFLNNDTEIRTPEWLEALVSLAERDDVGAVGPLLVYPNGTVQHAGVVLGMRGTADHIMRGFPATVDGHAGSLSCAREVSAVTAACMAIRREAFLEAGGFDEHFGTHYQDVDLCLRLGRSGLRNLFTPRAVIRHDESATRGDDYDHLDRALLIDTWGETIARGDPYYSPWLSLSGADYRPKAAA